MYAEHIYDAEIKQEIGPSSKAKKKKKNPEDMKKLRKK